MNYPINEFFLTLQGEGFWTGFPMLFLRMQGCDVQCAWCDTQESWFLDPALEVTTQKILSKKLASPCWSFFEIEDLLRRAESHSSVVRRLCITGGEPAQYDLRPLCQLFEASNWQIHLETSGTEPLQCSEATWVTLSPKFNTRNNKQVLPEGLARAQEIKIPIARPADLTKADLLLQGVALKPDVIISLQPVSQSPTMTRWCIEKAIERNWQLSVQTHKYLHVR